MLNIAAFTQGQNIPSARFRVRQLIPEFTRQQLNLTEYPAIHGSYPPAEKLKRPLWLSAALYSRYGQLRKARIADLCILQREFISTLPTIEALSHGPRILDVDDSIWLYRRGMAADNLGRLADHIVCGNNFLADYFTRFGKPVTIIPTAVDTVKFHPVGKPEGGRRVIGWSGTFGGYEYFRGIEQELGRLLAAHPDWTLRIVSDRPPPFTAIPAGQLEYIPWSTENEASSIAGMDIGLMPLDDTLWSRGKCSYKMLLYMACGVPVVVSDVGMNYDILRMAPVGLGVTANWVEAIAALMTDAGLRKQFGSNGRTLVEQRFSLSHVGQQWAQVISTLRPDHANIMEKK
jgi:glycosyltransferase involved in cell wall biosynthesis